MKKKIVVLLMLHMISISLQALEMQGKHQHSEFLKFHSMIHF
jgi:hypothetical protein